MNKRTLLAAALVCGLSPHLVPANAQGFFEMGGSLRSSSKNRSTGSLHGAVNQLYGGRSSGSSNSGSAPSAPRIDPEDAAKYAAQANKAYAAGMQAQRAGHADEALKQFDAAVTIRERVWGLGDPAIAEILRKEADIYRQQDKSAECLAKYRKLLACEIKRFGPGTPELEKTLAELAALCDKQGETKDAVSYYKQLVAIQAKDPKAKSADLKNARLKLATNLTISGDYRAAEQLLKEAISNEQMSGTPDKPYLANLLDNYGALLRETDRNSDAEAMEARAKALRDESAPDAGKQSPNLN